MTRPTGVIKMLIDETSPDAKEEEMTKKIRPPGQGGFGRNEVSP